MPLRESPHGSVGIVQVLSKKQCPVTLRKSPTRQCGDRFKSFLQRSFRSNSAANPPHGSVGIGSSPFYKEVSDLTPRRIPHTAVWGSFKSFLKNSARSHFANPPHGSVGIVQVLSKKQCPVTLANPPHGSVGIVQVLSKKQCPVTLRESPTRQCGDRSSPF
jgi:hypothetical protein